MKIAVDDIKDAPRTLAYHEDVADLDARLGSGSGDYRAADDLDIELTHYRAGEDLFFTGALHGHLKATCARCLEEFDLPVDEPFTFVLVPRKPATTGDEELAADDLALSFYEGKEIDLAPLVHEQAILALPTRPLCREDCRGLCPQCGANLNTGPCGCAAAPAPPTKLGVLRTLVRRGDEGE